MLHDIEELKMLARKEKATLEAQPPSLFSSKQNDIVEQIFLHSSNLRLLSSVEVFA